MNSRSRRTCTFESLEPRLLMSGTSLTWELFSYAHEVHLPAAGSVTVGGTIAAPGQTELYKFTVPARGKLYVDMHAADGDIDPYLQIFTGWRSRPRRTRRNDNVSRWTVNSRIRLGSREGRTFYIFAGGKQTAGDYELTLTSQPIDDCGNTFETARTRRLSRRGAVRKRGRINYAGDLDVLKIVATQTGTMTVQTHPSGRYSDLICELSARDAEGQLLAEDDDGEGPSATVSFDVVSGQTYYVTVAGGDSTTGRYQVRMATHGWPVPPPGPPAPDPDAMAGEVVTAEARSISGGLQLRILGTDQADTITVSQCQTYVTLQTDSSTQTFAGSFSSIVAYGFSGNDTIRFTHTVTAASFIYAGDGNDTIFEAGSGTAVLYAGDGNDLLVSVGGGQDTLNGQGGDDSFWFDGGDQVRDASATENTAGAVHRIVEFYQPYTAIKSSSLYIPLEIAGQNFLDPTTTFYASGYRDFADVPLFADGPQYDDVVQGAVGDCYYLASLASLADTDPGLIDQMIAPMGDGTFAVRFYRAGKEVYLRLDADLPVSGSGWAVYARLGPDGELWVPLLEKAYAHFRYGENSYGSLSGGWMTTVYREVTGQEASWWWVSSIALNTYSFIADSLAAGHAVTMGSRYDAYSPIVGSHAYMVKSVEANDDGHFVTLYNPWGVDGRSWDGKPDDGLLTISIEQVQEHFSAVVVSAV